MIIGLASCCFCNGDLSFNLSQIEKAMRGASGKAQLLCFGESFLQGFDALCWEYDRDCEIAVSQDSPVMDRLKEMTLRWKVDLLLGYVEKAECRLFSSCVLIQNGNILHNYRRISSGWKPQWVTDGRYCEGRTSAEFRYREHPMRIALCGDLWEEPSAFRTDGLLLWPIYVNFSRKEWLQYEQEYAVQAQFAARHTLMVNSVSHDPESLGGAFYFRDGEIADRIPYGEETVLDVEI